jgi:NAD(P)-dependent dehydrogenase (short-subunit alcohol dehydrogenase family)
MTGRVLITGASGALGKCVVRRFLDAGQTVLAVQRGAAAETMGGAAAPPGAIEQRTVDLASSAGVARLFAEAAAELASPPVVVHLVGGFRYARLRDLTDEDWSSLLAANLESSLRVFRECARLFERAGGGALVAVSSPAALLGEAGMAGYAATKAGMLRLVESLAREVAPFGGRANAVLPGTMDTPANRQSMPDADRSAWVSAGAVAEGIHFLTTPAAAAVNGAAIRVPGGIL